MNILYAFALLLSLGFGSLFAAENNLQNIDYDEFSDFDFDIQLDDEDLLSESEKAAQQARIDVIKATEAAKAADEAKQAEFQETEVNEAEELEELQ